MCVIYMKEIWHHYYRVTVEDFITAVMLYEYLHIYVL